MPLPLIGVVLQIISKNSLLLIQLPRQINIVEIKSLTFYGTCQLDVKVASLRWSFGFEKYIVKLIRSFSPTPFILTPPLIIQ